MTTAIFTPADLDPRSGELVEVLRPARVATGRAFTVHGLESGRTYLAWSDELTTADVPEEVPA